MAIFAEATWKSLSGRKVPFTGGPKKIVHHTTEGSTAAGAMETFLKNGSEPHFTVDNVHIWQHLDTDHHAYCLRNKPAGNPETNKDGAIQIEIVGFAHLAKGAATLENVAKLCRWLEEMHDIPREWPNGYPKPAENGKDPGGHNRDAINWDTKGGHYGHCHVPKNDHWDPAYNTQEVEFLMNWEITLFMSSLEGANTLPPALRDTPSFEGVESTMPDHAIGGD